ncbi:MAG: hypothetical protein B0D92_01965 [Spirochaeta sp. LUC14_002_19_P3]|nr:MAG: hypothetical protein B0D92_01965 [Spirochaeta sp. LUC14_002_19_P3]
MKKKQERIIWISITSSLLLLLAVIIFSPVVSAQSYTRDKTQIYLKDLETALYTLQNYYVDPVEAEKLFKGAIEGMFASLNDPYTAYLDNEFLQRMTDTTEGSYGGVGIYISQDYFDPENPYGRLPYVKVVSPIEDTPSWKAGINAGDYIYAIEDESAEGFSTQDVSDRLRGAPGSNVTVTILRDEDIIFDVTLKREKIEIPTVKSTIIDNEIAYLRIIEFTPFTEQKVQEFLNDFKDRGLKLLIVDVRSNPGGLLDSVVNIANHFFSGGIVVSTKYRQENYNQVYRASLGKIVASNVKIAVLIDRGSASASEILTGALKDRGRAVVIGETSFGKGSIQQMIPFQDENAAIKLTTGRYYTPNGNNIDKKGIEPDIVVKKPELTDEETKAFTAILQENRVTAFIDKYPNPTRQQVDAFVNSLHEEGLGIDEYYIRFEIQRERNSRLNVPPVVNLEFDRTLIRAVEFLRTGK